MPNAVAYAALLAWPIVVALLFARLRTAPALIWSIVAGVLLLPEATALDAPLLPAWDKTLAPSLSAAVMCVAMRDRERRLGAPPPVGWLPQDPLMRALALIFLLQPIAAVFTNADPFMAGPRVIPGMTPYDAASVFYGQAAAILPFLLARRYLADAASHRLLLRIMVAAALVYSLPILFEARMSPQLHNWVYGFRPRMFLMSMRGDGYRPSVFFPIGLATAVFVGMSLLAAATLARAERGELRMIAAAATAWLSGIMVVMKSLGALLLAALLLPAALLLGARLRLAIATALAVTALAFPLLRGVDLFPTAALVEAAGRVSEDRAQSLEFRFEHEDALLARAAERPLFGWGAWGRERIYDPWSGADMSVTDSRWIITFGQRGWVGYLAEFGLLCGPVLLAAMRRRSRALPEETIGLALMLALALIDLMVNGFLNPVIWLVAGATLGRVEQPASTVAAQSAESRTTRKHVRAGPAIGAVRRRRD